MGAGPAREPGAAVSHDQGLLQSPRDIQTRATPGHQATLSLSLSGTESNDLSGCLGRTPGHWSLVRPSGLELFKLVFPSKQGILIMTGAWSKFDILYFITIHSEQRNGPSSFLAMNFSIGF